MKIPLGLQCDFFSLPLSQCTPKEGPDYTRPFLASTLSLYCMSSRTNNFRGKNPPILLWNQTESDSALICIDSPSFLSLFAW